MPPLRSIAALALLSLSTVLPSPIAASPLNGHHQPSSHHAVLARAHATHTNESVHLPIHPHRGDVRSNADADKNGKRCRLRMDNHVDDQANDDCDGEVNTDTTSKRSSHGSKGGGSKSKGKKTSGDVAVSSAGGNANGANAGRAEGSKKHGLAWPNGDQDGASSWCGSNIGWYYTWSPWATQSLTDCGVEFVPMLWGKSQIGDFLTQQWSWPASTKHVLFVNEPNQDGQSDMTVGEAVDMWWKYMEPLAQRGYSLGLAGTTSAPSGKTWIQDFIWQCNGCSISFLPLHWYDIDGQNFQNYVNDFHQTFNLKIWVTEWACQNFNGGAQCPRDYIFGDFYDQTVGWMDNQDFIERHAWFGAMHNMQNVNYDNQLMGGDGRPNDLGWRYVA